MMLKITLPAPIQSFKKILNNELSIEKKVAAIVIGNASVSLA
jgi:hypothetical protein